MLRWLDRDKDRDSDAYSDCTDDSPPPSRWGSSMPHDLMMDDLSRSPPLGSRLGSPNRSPGQGDPLSHQGSSASLESQGSVKARHPHARKPAVNPSRRIRQFFRGEKDTHPRTITVPIWKSAFKVQDLYGPNVVRNQRYNFVTFFPLVLYEQFKFFFNLYFLLVALSQFIPQLQIGYLITYFGPLSFVLAITIGKEAYDDYSRYLRDFPYHSRIFGRKPKSESALEANSQLYTRLGPLGKEVIPSSKIRVGDLILIEKNNRIPADCVLLRSTEADGSCFVRTDQLDGETDWKLRLAVDYTQKLGSDDHLLGINASVYADRPHKDIHSFMGNFTRHPLSGPNPTSQRSASLNPSATTSPAFASTTPSSNLTDPLDINNTLWMNTVLASSGHVIALVVYTGKDTRAVMNTTVPRTKMGKVDLEINDLSKILCGVTFALSITLIALNGFRGLWYIYLVRFLILFSSIIPISLRVNLDMGKTAYSYFIMRDKEIPNTIVRTSTIPEELGRIEYLLSDKTGTLTRNEMDLRRLHMGTMSYSVETMDDIRNTLDQVYDPANREGQEGAGRGYKRSRDIATRIRDIIQALAVCHNVTPVFDSVGNITYQASSPDEIAIVKFTELVGLTLVHRDAGAIRVKARSGVTVDYEILDTFPFTSETKRMGIIVREKASREVWFYEKGADVIMAKIVAYNDWLDEECGNMAREGLRTLVVGRKRLSEEFYAEFKAAHTQAKISLDDRAREIQRVVGEYLEKDLELLGLTGVEDKLQDDVKNTLESLRNAGLKIWMLTGDKIETATCIAVSSKLIARGQPIHQISKVSDPMRALDELDILRSKTNTALVIDGESLQCCLDNYKDQFMELSVRLPVVVACRCSPTQKAEVVKFIKIHTGRRVCAIGDGGNDVSMIQQADVGVGIVGKEGKQASLAADFSVTQFSFLTRLLLWHGRNSYKRTAKLSQFVIHRGLIISIMQAVFSAIFYFAPIALYQGLLLVGYSTAYTMAPVFSLVLDKDVNADIALMYPELYKEVTKGRALSYKTFFMWVMISVYQGGAIMLLAIALFENEFINVVSITFTALILNELLMVALEITKWHRYMIYALISSVGIYIGSMAILTTDFDLSFIFSVTFLWKVSVITGVAAAPLFVIKRVRLYLKPPSYIKLGN